eukprot:11803147-Karenia_brevis.AAC.1
MGVLASQTQSEGALPQPDHASSSSPVLFDAIANPGLKDNNPQGRVNNSEGVHDFDSQELGHCVRSATAGQDVSPAKPLVVESLQDFNSQEFAMLDHMHDKIVQHVATAGHASPVFSHELMVDLALLTKFYNPALPGICGLSDFLLSGNVKGYSTGDALFVQSYVVPTQLAISKAGTAGDMHA